MHARDAGLRHGDCVSQGVVYCMVCTHWEEFYVGETDRTVRETFNEHYRDANKPAEGGDSPGLILLTRAPRICVPDSRQGVLTSIAKTTGSG